MITSVHSVHAMLRKTAQKQKAWQGSEKCKVVMRALAFQKTENDGEKKSFAWFLSCFTASGMELHRHSILPLCFNEVHGCVERLVYSRVCGNLQR